MSQKSVAIIGGSGLYDLLGEITLIDKINLDTPYGEISSDISLGEYEGNKIAFISRHGEKHTIAPHQVNYRANIWALNKLGFKNVISVNAVGSINSKFTPQSMAIPDQIIDYTHSRVTTFCEDASEPVVHIDFTVPFTQSLREIIIKSAHQLKIEMLQQGVYGCTQGPRLETAAEIKKYQNDGCDMIGMTAMPEAALARELELNYASIAISANWAAGIQDECLSLQEILNNLESGMAQVKTLMLQTFKNL